MPSCDEVEIDGGTALGWVVTLCDTCGIDVSSDDRLIAVITALRPRLEQPVFGRHLYVDKLRHGAILLAPRDTWDSWYVDTWYVGYSPRGETVWEALAKASEKH